MHTSPNLVTWRKKASGQVRAGQDRTGEDRTGQDRTGQDRTGQDRTGQDKTKQDKTRQDGWDRTKNNFLCDTDTCSIYCCFGQDRTKFLSFFYNFSYLFTSFSLQFR